MPLALAVSLALVLSGCGSRTDLATLRAENALADRALWRERQATLAGPLTPEEAVRLALQHNLEIAVLERERAIREEAATGARLAMLPGLQLSGEYSRRDKHRASVSESLFTGRTSLEASYSSEKTTRTFDISLLWNVLDFGVSYVRARQAEDRVRILRTQIARARQTLALRVTEAYYRAAVADRVVREGADLLGAIAGREALVEAQLADRSVPELRGLTDRERLLLLRMRLEAYGREAREARAELAGLIGLSPSAEIAFPADALAPPGPLPTESPEALQALEEEALLRRPELAEKDLEARVNAAEIRARTLELLPSPDLFVKRSTERNRFLYYTTWHEAGVRASWDLLRLPAHLSGIREEKRGAELIRARRLAMAVGILVQTRLAVIGYEEARERHGRAGELATLRARRLDALRRQAAQGERPEAEVLEMRAETLFAKADHWNALGELATGRARVLATVGRVPLAAPSGEGAPGAGLVPARLDLARTAPPGGE
jgi:outer membrane protein TolC